MAADSPTQHLSYLETGRAQPSREMVMRLAEHLEVPLRERNTLLLSAGFAPAFQERSLTELKSACLAIAQVLQTHKPYPAFAVDRYWNIVLSNEAIPQLYVDVARTAAAAQCGPADASSARSGAAGYQLRGMAVLCRHRAAPANRSHDRPGCRSVAERGAGISVADWEKSPAPTDKAGHATPLQIATDEGICRF